jgi:hypothetical protein
MDVGRLILWAIIVRQNEKLKTEAWDSFAGCVEGAATLRSCTAAAGGAVGEAVGDAAG